VEVIVENTELLPELPLAAVLEFPPAPPAPTVTVNEVLIAIVKGDSKEPPPPVAVTVLLSPPAPPPPAAKSYAD
jgi:hypothetical protein